MGGVAMPPRTRYARSGDLSLAYQVLGDGPLDIVFFSGWISHLDLAWEDPLHASFYERLASFSRLILFDKRGTGLSDREVGASTIEERMDDVRAVMDAVDSQRAALFGLSEGGPLSILFAASHPSRVEALVLCNTYVGGLSDEEFPPGCEERLLFDEMHRLIERGWGEGVTLPLFAPSLQHIPAARDYMARFERGSASPGTAHAHLRWAADIDVRPIVPSVRVPTLVLQRAGDLVVPVGMGRWLGSHLPEARYIEYAGQDHPPWIGNSTELLDDVQEFLTGSRGEAPADRILATVLLTDIVDSTKHAAELGDHHWRALLDRHDAIARQQIERFQGRVIKSTGDGVLAMFDGPARAVKAASAARESVRSLEIHIRAGVHTGEVELRGDDIGGMGVHIAQRVQAAARPDEVAVSRTVVDLVAGSGLLFADRGEHKLKGVQGTWRIFAVEG